MTGTDISQIRESLHCQSNGAALSEQPVGEFSDLTGRKYRVPRTNTSHEYIQALKSFLLKRRSSNKILSCLFLTLLLGQSMLGLPGNPEGMNDPALFRAPRESEEPRNPATIESKASRFICSSQSFQCPSSLHPAGAPS